MKFEAPSAGLTKKRVVPERCRRKEQAEIKKQLELCLADISFIHTNN
jgi:hypothetical protein